MFPFTPVLGYVDVQVEYESQDLILPLIVVKGQVYSDGNWPKKIKLNCFPIHNVTISSALDNLLQKHQSLFLDRLRTLQGFHA